MLGVVSVLGPVTKGTVDSVSHIPGETIDGGVVIEGPRVYGGHLLSVDFDEGVPAVRPTIVDPRGWLATYTPSIYKLAS